MYHINHAVKQIRCATCYRSVLRKCRKMSFHCDRLSTKCILTIFHSGCHHAVTDKYDTRVTKQLECCAYHSRSDMDSITYLLNISLLMIERSTDDSRLTMYKWRHCVEKMCHMRCSCFYRLARCLIIRFRMRDRELKFVVALLYTFCCSVNLRS